MEYFFFLLDFRHPVSHILLYREMRRFIDVYKAKVLKLTEEMWIDSWSNLK